MKNTPTRRALRTFFRSHRAKIGLTILLPIVFFAFTSELWSHYAPFAMKREGKWFFPSVNPPLPFDLGIEDSFVVDYQELNKQDQLKGNNSRYFFPINSWDPFQQGSDALQAPSRTHFLGTDSLGRDVFARLLYGIRVSLVYGVFYWLFTFFLGILVGLFQGYRGGRLDFGVERLKELGEIIPFLSAVIIVNGLTASGSFMMTLLVVAILSWFSISSQVRAQVLTIRKREYVEAAKALGAQEGRVLFRHVLPNSLTPILALTPFSIASGISILAVLDFLGFGLSPPTPSLGELLSQGKTYVSTAPWLLLAPTVALCLVLLSINLIGEALRKALDPRS